VILLIASIDPIDIVANQGFLLVKLTSSLRKFDGRNHDRYEMSVSHMITDMFHLP